MMSNTHKQKAFSSRQRSILDDIENQNSHNNTAMRGILRSTQPHTPHPHERHVTFSDRSQTAPLRSSNSRLTMSSRTPLGGYAGAGSSRSTVSSRAPQSGYADAGSFRGYDEELNRVHRMQTLPCRAATARGKTTDSAIRYLAQKTGCKDGSMFGALCAKQLGKVWIEARRMAGEKEGERERALEEDVRKRLMDEEQLWKKAYKEERRSVRAREKKELGKFVERFVGIRRDVFDSSGGKEVGNFCTVAVREAMKQLHGGGRRIR